MDMAEAEAFLMQPHIRKHVQKLVYAEEWATSIAESHPDGPGRDAVIQKHWDEVEIIRRALAPYQHAIADLHKKSMDKSSASTPRVAWF